MQKQAKKFSRNVWLLQQIRQKSTQTSRGNNVLLEFSSDGLKDVITSGSVENLLQKFQDWGIIEIENKYEAHKKID